MRKMNALRMLSITGCSMMLMFLVLLFVPLSASAQTYAPARHGSSSPSAHVTVKIVKAKKGYEFKPTSVTVTQGEKATLVNKTAISQSITYQGLSIYTIPAHSSVTATVSFSPGTYVVNLKSNSKAMLTIIVK
jgi:plastocyanin